MPHELLVPRLDSPRVRVPAGSVAIADRRAAVYPRESPGGWLLLGRTGLVLWDLAQPRPADVLRIGTSSSGVRSYVAARGGLAVPVTLGSGSRDTLAGLGPASLAVGDLVGVGRAAVTLPLVDHAVVRAAAGPLRVVLGPREDRLAPESVRMLPSTPWTVTSAADRVGYGWPDLL